MKRIVLFLAILSTASYANAQAEPILKSKKGNYILPQTGDWGLGINASPVLFYLGNMFNNNGNPAPSLNFHNTNQGLYFKYFINEKHARRAGLRLMNYQANVRDLVDNLDPDAEPNTSVTDIYKQSEFQINLTYGFEKRRGAGRLQGIYGVEGIIGYGTGNRMKVEYGNSMEFYADSISNQRITKNPSSSSYFNIGLQGFIGFEYFFAPKISIGGEFNLTALYNIQGELKHETENWDNVEGVSTFESTVITSRVNSFSFGTNNFSSNFRLLFYF